MSAQVVNTYDESQENAYSCDYVNGKVLYENASGSDSNITLSDNVSNYSRIDILSAPPGSPWDNYGVKITTIYPNISQKWELECSAFGAYWGALNYEIITVSNLSITRGTSFVLNGSNGTISNTFSPDTTNKAKIYKVIGYK